MNSREVKVPLSVQVPAPDDDRPSWVKVGVIAAVGFIIGVAWPRLAGVRLGPSAPAEATAAAASAAPRAVEPGAPAPQAAVMASAAAPGVGAVNAAAVPSAGASASQITAIKQTIVACRTDDGETLKGPAACGSLPGFDAIAMPKLRKLSQCATADGAIGRLTVNFNVDFAANKITSNIGRNSTVENQDTLLMCVQSSFQSVTLGAIDHSHVRYSLSYGISFAPKAGAAPVVSAPAGGKGAAAAAAPRVATPSAAPVEPQGAQEATAQVMWEVAIVRDAPRTGAVVARLQRGAQVHIGRGQEGWYHVKYGPGFSSEGWVYRNSIGR